MTSALNGASSILNTWWNNSGKTTAVLLVSSAAVQGMIRLIMRYIPSETAEERQENATLIKATTVGAVLTTMVAAQIIAPAEYQVYSAKKVVGYTLVNIAAQAILERATLDHNDHHEMSANSRRICVVMAAPMLSMLGYLPPALVTGAISGFSATVTGVCIHEDIHGRTSSWLYQTATHIQTTIAKKWFYPISI